MPYNRSLRCGLRYSPSGWIHTIKLLLTIVIFMLALACEPVSSDFTQSESELAINPQTERELLTSATLLALGDSYTIGQSVAEKDRWPEQLARSLEDHCLRLQLSIIAQTGWTTDELADSLQDASFSPPYDLVSLLVGVNNQFRGFPITDFENEFRELLEQAIICAASIQRTNFNRNRSA